MLWSYRRILHPSNENLNVANFPNLMVLWSVWKSLIGKTLWRQCVRFCSSCSSCSAD